MCDQNPNDLQCMDCKNELNLCKLCVERVKADKIHTKWIKSDNACVDHLKSEDSQSNSIVANDICASGKVYAKELFADSFGANSLCAKSGTINDLCVTNLSVQNKDTFLKYRASVTNAANSLYTLGTPIQWNTKLDDPNNNVSFGPFAYTVPLSGYYSASFHLESDTLSGANPIVGNPVGLLRLLVNGLPLQNQQSPFLAFSDAQSSNLSSLLLLKAGDVITMSYDVLVFDQASGLIPYVGTINLKANGSFPNSSSFTIHLLSNELGVTPPQCMVCPLVEIPCSPLSIDCDMNCSNSSHSR